MVDEEARSGAPVAGRGFDAGVFAQGDVWVDEGGRTFYVEDLTVHQRLLLLQWLRRHARHFYLQVLRHELATLLTAVEAPSLADLDRNVPDLLFLSAEQWLEGTPLATALASEVA